MAEGPPRQMSDLVCDICKRSVSVTQARPVESDEIVCDQCFRKYGGTRQQELSHVSQRPSDLIAYQGESSQMSDEMQTIEIGLGAFRPPLAEQLRDQGLPWDEAECEKWEGHRLAISRLAVHGLLTDVERKAAGKRLFKHIQKDVARRLAALEAAAAD